ncbi:hypothetical protein [Oceanobacter mangrovi]|uniref:hypothetical protein n=1 Tax=Oceanobacter mangrovi TaxID=2862510 RepID=UPI001C8D9479|nr:hypothetical protein [Oceanobacter mangrovi]
MKIQLQWKSGTPTEPGMYFIANKLGELAGEFEFARWSGSEWLCDHPINPIGYVSLETLKNNLSIQWPEEYSGELAAKTRGTTGYSWGEV